MINIVNYFATRFYFVRKSIIKRNNTIIGPTKHIILDINGVNNVIRISNTCVIKKAIVRIYGNGNSILLGNNNSFNDVLFGLEDSNSKIVIGNDNTFFGFIDFSVMEGGTITIGNNCLFSRDIEITNGDSHSIIDSSGKRTNQSKDVAIGDHVWIGKKVLIFKGGSIGSNSVVGGGSVVTKNFLDSPNCTIAGNPARIIKNCVNWIIEKL